MIEQFRDKKVPSQGPTEQEQIITGLLLSLLTAPTIKVFEIQKRKLEEHGAKLPDNIQKLEEDCLKRNKETLEFEITTAKTDTHRKASEDELKEINTRLKNLEKSMTENIE